MLSQCQTWPNEFCSMATISVAVLRDIIGKLGIQRNRNRGREKPRRLRGWTITLAHSQARYAIQSISCDFQFAHRNPPFILFFLRPRRIHIPPPSDIICSYSKVETQSEIYWAIWGIRYIFFPCASTVTTLKLLSINMIIQLKNVARALNDEHHVINKEGENERSIVFGSHCGASMHNIQL